MSLYYINKNGLWSSKSEEEKRSFILESSYIFDTFLEYLYTTSFVKLRERLSNNNHQIINKLDYFLPFVYSLYQIVILHSLKRWIKMKSK